MSPVPPPISLKSNVEGVPHSYLDGVLDDPSLAVLKGIKFERAVLDNLDTSAMRYCGVVLPNTVPLNIRAGLKRMMIDVQHAVFFGSGKLDFEGIYSRAHSDERAWLRALDYQPQDGVELSYEAARDATWFSEGTLPHEARVSIHPDDVSIQVVMSPTLLPLARSNRTAMIFYAVLDVRSLDRVSVRDMYWR